MLASLLVALLSPSLDAILDASELKGALYSATVTDLDGKVLYQRNTDQRVMPASNQKLISCSYALHELGSDFVAKTKIWKQGNRVYVESNGDPSLTYAQLADAKKTLKLSGRDTVYLKQAYRGGVPESWELDDLPNRYAAQVAAFTFDQAAFELWAENGKAFLLPSTFGVKVKFDSKLKPGTSQYDPLKRTAWVGANLPKTRTRLDTLALPDPDGSASSILGRKLVYTNDVPNRAPDLTITGQPIGEMLKFCLVHSDNNMAENFLLMAASKQGPLGEHPYELARERVTKFLTDTVGVDKEDIHIYDGSGMSRHNLVTSRAISKLLLWANRQPTAPLWKSCLVSPLNGTLKGRLKDVDFRGKTGTLDMVVSLSGYVKPKDGTEVIMSFLLNHFTCSSVKARDILDNFAKTLYENADGTWDAIGYNHEARSAVPRNLPTDWNWVDRLDRDRRTSRPGKDRRTESRDAPLYRAQ